MMIERGVIHGGVRKLNLWFILTAIAYQQGALTHHRLAMPFRNRKKYFRGAFQFSIVSN